MADAAGTKSYWQRMPERVDEDAEEIALKIGRITMPQAAEEDSAAAMKSKRAALDADEMFHENQHHLRAIEAMDVRCAGAPEVIDASIVHKHYAGFDEPAFGGGERRDDVIDWRRARPAQIFMPDQNLSFGAFNKDADKDKLWLHVHFGLCSQLPYLQLTVHLKPGRVVVHIFATNLDHEVDRPFRWHAAPDKELDMLLDGQAYIKNDRGVMKAWQENKLSWIGLELLSGNRQDREGRPNRIQIGGDVTLQSLEAWASKVKEIEQGEIPEGMTEQEVLLGILHSGNCDNLELITTRYTKNTVQEEKELRQCIKWFSTVMHLSLEVGNFWWYRLQFPQIDWQNFGYPFYRADAPRWMVTAWAPRKYADKGKGPAKDTSANLGDLGDIDMENIEAEGRIIPPMAVEWSHFRYPKAWPGTEEYKFASRLGEARERSSQTTTINRVLRDAETPAHAHFERNPCLSGSWLVSVLTGVEPQRLRKALPEGGNLVTISFPDSRRAKMIGVYVDDFSLRAGDVVFSVTAGSDFHGTKDDESLDVDIHFHDNPKSYQRRMWTLEHISTPPESRTKGVDISHFITGINRTKATDPAVLQQDWRKHGEGVDSVKDWSNLGLNQEQIEAVQSAFTSTSGAIVIQGAPGTGKTRVQTTKLHALLNQGLRVLVVAPTNAARDVLADAWMRHLSSAEPKSKFEQRWCIFENIYMHSDRKIRPTATTPQNLDHVSLEEAARWNLFTKQVDNKAVAKFDEYGFARRRHLFAADHASQLEDLNAQEYIRLLQDCAALEGKDKKELGRLDSLWSKWYLDWCRVVFVTCNLSCHPTLLDNFEADVILCDEAGLATVVDAATPCVAYNETVKVVVLTGDSKQQSPVTLSERANESFCLSQKSILAQMQDSHSMILQDERYPVIELREQFRMHSHIAAYPNAKFYAGSLRNAPGVDASDALGRTIDRLLEPTKAYFNGQIRRRIAIDERSTVANRYPGTESLKNDGEVRAIGNLINTMLNFPALDSDAAITPSDLLIISPYAGQVKSIKRMLHTPQLIDERAQDIRVMTSYSAQGSEAPIVIISLVVNRPERPYAAGFISNKEQILVEATRASQLCIFVGPFGMWLDANASVPKMGDFHMRPLMGLVYDLWTSEDIIEFDDLYDAWDPATPTLSRERSRYRSQAGQRGRGRFQGQKRRADASTGAIQDPSTGKMLKGIFTPRGGRGGRGGARGGGATGNSTSRAA